MPKLSKPNTVITFDSKEFKCLECEGVFKLTLPVELKVFIAQSKAFNALHKYCK